MGDAGATKTPPRCGGVVLGCGGAMAVNGGVRVWSPVGWARCSAAECEVGPSGRVPRGGCQCPCAARRGVAVGAGRNRGAWLSWRSCPVETDAGGGGWGRWAGGWPVAWCARGAGARGSARRGGAGWHCGREATGNCPVDFGASPCWGEARNGDGRSGGPAHHGGGSNRCGGWDGGRNGWGRGGASSRWGGDFAGARR